MMNDISKNPAELYSRYGWTDSDPESWYYDKRIEYCFGLPFLSPEEAKHVGDKNVFGETIIWEKLPGEDWKRYGEPSNAAQH